MVRSMLHGHDVLKRTTFRILRGPRALWWMQRAPIRGSIIVLTQLPFWCGVVRFEAGQLARRVVAQIRQKS